MKKQLALMLSLMLVMACAPALGDTVRDVRAQAADGWHAVYEAHGRTVTVDIPVRVPDAEAFPVLEAQKLGASAVVEELRGTGVDGAEYGGQTVWNRADSFRCDTPALSAVRRASRDHPEPDPPRGTDMQPLIVHVNDIDPDTAYTYNNPATVRSAGEAVRAVCAQYFPDLRADWTPSSVYAYLGRRAYDDRTRTYSGDVWPQSNGPLTVNFCQVVRGIPVLCRASDSVLCDADEPGFCGAVCIQQAYGMDEPYRSVQLALVKETGVLEADAALCGFEVIRGTYERLIADGLLRRVDSLRLGYVRQPDGKGGYRLLPAWVLEGELFPSADAAYSVPVTEASPEPVEYGFVIVDARTGELVGSGV